MKEIIKNLVKQFGLFLIGLGADMVFNELDVNGDKRISTEEWNRVFVPIEKVWNKKLK